MFLLDIVVALKCPEIKPFNKTLYIGISDKINQEEGRTFYYKTVGQT